MLADKGCTTELTNHSGKTGKKLADAFFAGAALVNGEAVESG